MKSISQFIFEKLSIQGSKTVIPLSGVDRLKAKESVKMGLHDGSIKDDQVDYKVKTFKCNDLRASQTELIIKKCLDMAIGKMLSKKGTIGGDLGAMVSKDGYIMDGHHRWGASFLCDPTALIEATQIMLDGENLVSALNIITAGEYDRIGNTAVGNIKDFNGNNVRKYLEEYVKSGFTTMTGKSFTAEKVIKRLGRISGADGDYLKGIEIMCKNADHLPKQILPNAPKRVDMPVIKKDEVIEVAKKLKAGVVDIVEPYFKK